LRYCIDPEIKSKMDVKEIERLIKISKEQRLMPETYIPWQDEPKPGDIFLPELLTSLQGLAIYDTLTPKQKLDLGRHELVQVIYSYGWGECTFCLFMTRHMLTLPQGNAEHKFLIREVIEEFRHQEMFTQAIEKLNGSPLPKLPCTSLLRCSALNTCLPTTCLWVV
jgi:hypothetical protein